MAKIEITKTELAWPGKYSDNGTLVEIPRVNLPFQVIETINESRATREGRRQKKQLSIFDVYEGFEGDTFEEGWRNKLIWGDNLLVMGSLLGMFAGKIDLVYIDPPFATGADFSVTTEVGESGVNTTKEQSLIEEKAYRDTWGKGTDSFISMLYERLILIRDLLSDNASIYVHLDHRMNSYVRILMDEVFGKEKFKNEIIWSKLTAAKAQSSYFSNVKDSILFYSKGDKIKFNPQFIQSKKDDKNYPYTEIGTGRKYGSFDFTQQGSGPARKFGDKTLHPPAGKHWIWSQDNIDKGIKEKRIIFTSSGRPRVKRYLDEKLGNYVGDLWFDDLVSPLSANSSERNGYPTQKPEALLKRIINASSNEGDLVADFFCGSGTTLAVAESLGRRWIGCDLGRWGIHVTRKRMLDIENCKPFEILNLGRYERQYWQGTTFGGIKFQPPSEQTIYEYLAFILKLYKARPISGMACLHGKKDKALVHIGMVDAPVTFDEINAAVDECISLKQTDLHVLGWEWEMGLQNLVVAEAKKRGVKLLLLQIPREVMEQQAVDKGDIQFFELAYLVARIETSQSRTVQVKLEDFVIPNTDLIPDEVRSKVEQWSDYIDYWAVDWDFQNDTFMQDWVAYRTRKERSLDLESDKNIYKKAGNYRILVKVIDVFGNDTSQVFDVVIT